MKLLLCRASPRSNIEEVERENKTLPCDRYIVRYENEIPAYENMRNFFLKHKEYDYMVLATDDIVVTSLDILMLGEALLGGKYPILSGYMNVEQEDYPDGDCNVTMELALKDRRLRSYHWLKREQVKDKNTIFLVKFNGFALTAIRRDIVEQIEFSGDGVFKGKGMKRGASLDFVFCWECHEKNIPIFVDPRIYLKHLRKEGTHQVKKRDVEYEFIKHE